MTAAPVPVLVKEKRWLTGPSTSRSVPKSHSYSSKTSAEMLFCAHPAAQTNSAAVSSTALFAIPYTFITIKPCKSIKYSCNEERRIHNNRYIGVPARQKQFGETLHRLRTGPPTPPVRFVPARDKRTSEKLSCSFPKKFCTKKYLLYICIPKREPASRRLTRDFRFKNEIFLNSSVG